MLHRLFIMLVLTSSWLMAAAQQEQGKKLSSFFERGKFDLHARSFYMSTINKNELTDFSTFGVGAGLGYLSPYYKSIRIGISGFFIWQLYEHNMADATDNGSRYELSLYDMHDPENNKDLDRLEELYIQYKNKRLELTLGRQKVHSPLLNEQDNRMRPNIFSGLMAHYKFDRLDLNGGWLTGVSPRGTINWYSIEESYGVYPFGRNIYGETSGYQQNMSSKGIGLLGVKYNVAKIKQQLWNYYAENVFNLSFAQTDYQLSVEKHTLLLGVQGFYQTHLNQGGNPDPAKAYIQPGGTSYGFGLRTGLRTGPHQLTLNYLGIGKQGRFLFPREWGRETFYASLPRERYEGSGGTTAYTLKYEYATPGKNITAMAGVGKADFPDVQNHERNKYQLPSYYHVVGRIDYRPKGFLEGMDIMLQAVHKIAQDPEKLTATDYLNKVDMWNLSVMVDYRF